ncbi:hypothetical protein NOK12_19740 [Nocardioides sp. OK12]|uniref:hypothetical protein n=1 Tax=Nocardioides sp. OK12 TaxID=2758661 RepID=UPI0021C4937A|nr:hypothetical protein [Nocardioides sp. OK12]GHJ59456.1 hypothetical protein NOK12_19740 [Nocardioides sp. OK12]
MPATEPATAGRTVRLGGTDYPVRLPSPRDPRLHLAVTISTLQVLGQTVLGWQVSIAQILLCLGTCAAIEIVVVARESGVLAWPASALLTGNGVALVLRWNGTEHGDWWSLQGWYVFAATAALALLSKYVLRHRGRPLVNPSNLGLVVCFLVVGEDLVNPLDFWWGDLGPALLVVYAVLLAGALAVTRRLGLLAMSLAFWGVLGVGVGALALTGHCFSARWSTAPVCGADLWLVVLASPEVLVFMFFMITDPMTSPRDPRSRVAFGAAVAAACTLLIATAETEFGAKVGLLGGLVAVCALRPVLGWARERSAVPASPASPMSRATVLALAAAFVPLVLVVGATTPAPTPTTSASDDASTPSGARPAVTLPAPPEVGVSAEVESIRGGTSGLDAGEMATDLLAALAIEHRALEERDPAMAATALGATRLAATTDAIRAGVAPATYDVDAVELVLVRDPSDEQAVPRFGLHATGSVDGRPLDRVFVLEPADGVWLLVDEIDPAAA